MLEAGTSDDVDTALLGVDAPEDEVRRHRSRPVEGFRTLVHAHFVVDEVEQIGNRWNIDTGAGCPGRNRLTLLQGQCPASLLDVRGRRGSVNVPEQRG